MKLAFLCESGSNAAAVRILAEGVLGSGIIPVGPPAGDYGWPYVRDVLPAILADLHYHTDADGLMVVVDSNDSPIHQLDHENDIQAHPKCRVCQLRKVVVQRVLRPRRGKPSLRTLIGLSVPSIEAWYRCGLDAQVTEASWINKLNGGTCPYNRQSLKRDVYGTINPLKKLELRRSAEEAHRLVETFPLLQQCFPLGFGSLAQELINFRNTS